MDKLSGVVLPKLRALRDQRLTDADVFQWGGSEVEDRGQAHIALTDAYILTVIIEEHKEEA